MDKKLNPLDWEIDLLWDTVSDIIRKLNPLTWRLELVYSADSYIQKINPFIWDFDMVWGTGASYITKEVTWNWYVNLTNAIANHLMQLKAYGWTINSDLPSWYTQLDYITLNKWYFDTWITPTTDTDYELKFTIAQNNTTQWIMWMLNNSTPANNFYFMVSSWNKFLSALWSSAITLSWLADAVANTDYIAKVNWETLTVNGVEATNFNRWTLEATQTIDLWCRKNSENNWLTWKLYYFKIWKWWNLVAHYIPCKRDSDDVLWYYDIINDTFGALLTSYWTPEAWSSTLTPTPDVPIALTCNNWVLKFSKNLANMVLPNVVEQYYIDNSWNILSSPVNFYYDTFIPVSPNTAYTLSGSKNFRYASLMEYDINQVFLKRTLIDNASTNAKTWTTRSDTAYIRFWSNPWSNETMTIDVVQSYNFQFERWSAPTPYHEYVEWWIYTDWTVETIEDELWNTATTEMLLKVWNYEDTQEILSGVIKRQIWIKILNWTENRAKTTIQTWNVFEADLLDNSMVNTLLCTHFVSWTPLNNNIVYKSAWSSMLQIRYDAMTTVEDLKAWLSGQYNNGSPVIVLYVKETETTETVAGQTMNIQAWSNTIEITQASIDNLWLYAKYKATA